MSSLLFLELTVCFFAVLGVYFIVCKLISVVSGKDHLSIGIHASRYRDIGDLDCTIKSTAFLRDGDKQALLPTVLLFDSEEDVCDLCGYDYDLEIYVKYRKVNFDDR